MSFYTKVLAVVSIPPFVGFAIAYSNLSELMQYLLVLISVLLASTITFLLVRKEKQGLEALSQGLQCFKDFDFSVRLAEPKDEYAKSLINLYNECADALQDEQLHIHQKQMLFENTIQNSNVLMLLCDEHGAIFYHNSPSDQIINIASPVLGGALNEYLETLLPGLSQRFTDENELVFDIRSDKGIRQYYLSQGEFLVGSEVISLLMLKDLSEQFLGKEAEIWRTTIKVVSHELNNTLAPIISMAQSGMMALDKQRYDTLNYTFNTILHRAQNLSAFIATYADLAKLPLPCKQKVIWQDFIISLRSSYSFVLLGALPEAPGFFDRVQMERVLINVLKNAHDSGSSKSKIELSVKQDDSKIVICIVDRGCGMSASVQTNALLPFYSTKTEGSGVGLALSHEVIRAHRGFLSIENRQSGGVKVSIELPVS